MNPPQDHKLFEEEELVKNNEAPTKDTETPVKNDEAKDTEASIKDAEPKTDKAEDDSTYSSENEIENESGDESVKEFENALNDSKDDDMAMLVGGNDIPKLSKVKNEDKFMPDLSNPENFKASEYKQENLNNAIQDVIRVAEDHKIDMDNMKYLNEHRELLNDDAESEPGPIMHRRSCMKIQKPNEIQLNQFKVHNINEMEKKIDDLYERFNDIENERRESQCNSTCTSRILGVSAALMSGIIIGLYAAKF